MRVLVAAVAACSCPALANELPAEFVYLRDIDDTIRQDIRYFGNHNFLGRRVDGYEAPECILTRTAAEALRVVQVSLRPQGLSLKVYDCYRPERAVRDFVRWSRNPSDQATKHEFYPTIDKAALFALKYLARFSSHSRGSAVDVTVLVIPTVHNPPKPQRTYRPSDQLEPCHLGVDQRFEDDSLDFGTGYDCFHEKSHTNNPLVSALSRSYRRMLVEKMETAGFKNYHREWWHFELKNPPLDRAFDFVIRPRPAVR